MIINPYASTSLEAATLWIQAHPELVVGLTSGSWDLFHDFHLRFLLRCRRVCDVLIVGVDSDAEVRKVKGPTRPIMSEFQRLMLLDANKHVTFAYVQDGVRDFTRVAETLLGVHGGVTFRNQLFAGRENEVALGSVRDKVQVVIIPDMEELNSTTALVARVAQGAGN
jgi:D-beta-D-heptose 7-phosphate kinase/D-beta-D-heptose 1-phosphate adenosyltransferase